LLTRVWQDQFVEEGNLTVHIASIRKALGELKNGDRFIATVPGRGYQFVGDVISNETDLVIEERSISRITVEHDADQNDASSQSQPDALRGLNSSAPVRFRP